MCEVHAAGRQAAPVELPRHRRGRRRRICGSASSRSTSCIRTAVRSASRPKAIPVRRDRTTPASATRTSATSPGQIVEEHIDICHDAGINLEGINAEVAKGQWEFQIFAKGGKKAGDDMWMARYLMARVCEKYGVDFELHCKPIQRRLERLRHAHATSRRPTCARRGARPTSRS